MSYYGNNTWRKRLKGRRLALEPLEGRLLLAVLPPSPDTYRLTPLDVLGPNDTTGIAVAEEARVYGVTDSYRETFEIYGLDAPHELKAGFSLDGLRTLTGCPPGSTSGGPDGMTSVTAVGNFFYVIAVSPFSTDAIYKIAADGSSAELFASMEIFYRGDRFNWSEIVPGPSADQFFLASTYGLIELDGSGGVVRDVAGGDFNGVAVVGRGLFALTDSGTLWADPDPLDGDPSLTLLVDLGQPVADLQFGSFGSVGEALFVLTPTGDVGYWTPQSLAGGNPGEPTWLFNVAGAHKLDFAERAMFVSLGEDALRIDEGTIELVALQTSVWVAEGVGECGAIRLSLASPPSQPVTVHLERIAGDADISVVDTEIQFDDKNWRADHYVRLTAAADADGVNSAATILATGPGLVPLEIVATERDKDGPLAIELRATETLLSAEQPELHVTEERTVSFQVNLTADPGRTVAVTVERADGDPDLRVEAHAGLQFDSTNWDRPRWVTIAADEDADDLDGSATFRCSVEGDPAVPARLLTVHEQDTDVLQETAAYDVLVDDYQAVPLQGELHRFDFYNRLRGDRGETYSPGTGTVEFRRGSVRAEVTGSGFAGVWHSVNHPVAEGIPLDFSALLPADVLPEFQYQVKAIRVEVLQGNGRLKLELRDPSNGLLWSEAVDVAVPPSPEGTATSLRVPLATRPGNVQLLTWVLDGPGSVEVSRVWLEVEGPKIGYLESFLWPYAAVLANFNADTGLTRDRAEFPAGAFDAVNASGAQAALAAVAAQLGIITNASAETIIRKTGDALGDLQDHESVGGVVPHFVRTYFVIDNDENNCDNDREEVTIQGPWVHDNALEGYYGGDYLQIEPGTGSNSVRWSFHVSRPGTYEVFARWTAADTHASNAPYQVTHAGGATTVTVDQRARADQWVSLGSYRFDEGDYNVALSDDADGTVIADAIRVEGPPHLVSATEYSTIDTLIGWAGVLVGADAMHMDDVAEQAIGGIERIDWSALVLSNGTISHGYRSAKGLIEYGWDTFGGESLLAALFYGAATGKLADIPNLDPMDLRTWNGSGFIDELPWLFVSPICTDAWGANWDAYRPRAAQRQVDSAVERSPLAPIFGLSAAEPPIPSQFPVEPGRDVAIPYVAYGVGGYVPPEDGSEMFLDSVGIPHELGLVASFEPQASKRMWDWMLSEEIVSPLNAVESLVVQQWGPDLETHFHGLKGTWDLALMALGTGRWLLGPDYPLSIASRAEPFTALALKRLTLIPLGEVDFQEPAYPGNLGPGEVAYGLKTMHPGFLTIEADVEGSLDGVGLVLYDEHHQPLATSSLLYGRQRIDWQVAANQTYYVKLSVGPDSGASHLHVANLVQQIGTSVIVFGSGGEDHFEFSAEAPDYRVTINDVRYDFPKAAVAYVAFDGDRQTDSATVVGSASDEAVIMNPGYARLSSPASGTQLTVMVDARDIVARSGGGSDSVQMTGSAGDDELVGHPTFARLTGPGFFNEAHGFRFVLANASDGHDTATLYDSPDNDVFVAHPDEDYAVLFGRAFYNRAKSFDSVEAVSSGGIDVAQLYDSPGDDAFVAGPASARLSGDGFSNQANKFRYVIGYASGGNDTATLDGSDAVDTFLATPTYGIFFGPDFYNRASLFDTVIANGTPAGGDVARLYDSPGDDTFVAQPTSATLSGPGFSNTASSFRYATAYSTAGGVDTADLYGTAADDRFEAHPTHAVMYGSDYYNGANYFESVTGHSTGGADVAKLYDSPGVDSFDAYLTTAVLSGTGFSNRADAFRYVTAYSDAGGNDTATLHGSSGDETITGTYDYTRYTRYTHLQGATADVTARAFEQVFVLLGQGGQDNAFLHDSTGDDFLEADEDWATLSYGDGTRIKLQELVTGSTVTANSWHGGHDTKRIKAIDFVLITLGPWEPVD